MIQFQISGRPISLNQIYTNHWTKRSANKVMWGWEIKAALLKYKVPQTNIPTGATMEFKFYVKRPIDCDNCAGTCKLITDYLREWGTLKNDSPEYVRKISIEVITKSPREYVDVTIN